LGGTEPGDGAKRFPFADQDTARQAVESAAPPAAALRAAQVGVLLGVGLLVVRAHPAGRGHRDGRAETYQQRNSTHRTSPFRRTGDDADRALSLSTGLSTDPSAGPGPGGIIGPPHAAVNGKSPPRPRGAIIGPY